MHNFIRTPTNEALNEATIGSVRAYPKGLAIHGLGVDELLCYVPCPPELAVAWRDALSDLLTSPRKGRSLPQIDWARIAISVSPQWAAEQGLAEAVPIAPPVGPVRAVAASTPTRRPVPTAVAAE